MRLSFRQGVVSHSTSPLFLRLAGTGVDIVADNRPVVVTIAHKETNYLWSEDFTQVNAWQGPFDQGTRYWLYWDFDPLTFERTFGFTIIAPISQPDEPAVQYQVNGQHWFDTATFTHYVYSNNRWVERIRVFAAELFNLSFFSMSDYPFPNFSGTQIAVNGTIRAGRVLFDVSGLPIQRDDMTFFTTEDEFFAASSHADSLRFGTNVVRAQCMEASIAAYTVVGWTGEGLIEQATYNMVGRGSPGEPLPPDDKTTVVGILLEDLNFREAGAVLVQGVVTNPAWNWTTVTRIGGPLWVDNEGMLVPQDPHFTDAITYPRGRVPVARVIASDTIIFEQGLGGKGERGSGDAGAGNIVNIGAGEGILASVENNDAYLKTLVAGDNITFIVDDDTITIESAESANVAHAALTGLLNDDHTQYFNEARGDARYLRIQRTTTPVTFTSIINTALANYDITLSDWDAIIRCTSGTDQTVTIPADITLNLPNLFAVHIRRMGAGAVRVISEPGSPALVTINGFTRLVALNSMVTIYKVGPNEWDVVGDVEEDV